MKIPPLGRDVLHLWRMSLDVPAQEMERYSSLLSMDEKERAEKFYFKKARDRYIAGRGLLRVLLGGYLNMEPAAIWFFYESNGKPFLKDQPIQFNVSHSEEAGVFAFCLNRSVGVDVEWRRPLADMDDLSQKFFTANESALLASLSGDDKKEFFYVLWTCKEAYLKAVGAGLLFPLDQVEVKYEAGGSVRLASSNSIEMDKWRVRIFGYQSDYQCAVCVEGGDVEIEFLLR